MTSIAIRLQSFLDQTRKFDFLPALALRLYLVPVFWMAGTHKFYSFKDTVAWFGNPDWGLGLPLPWLMAFLATAAELLGAIALLLGFMTRWISVPLMATMVVAALTVHADYGWQAIADPSAPLANERVAESSEKLSAAKSILQEHGHYEWLTSSGNFVVLNNGVEFAVTYLVMLLSLFFIGGGRYLSVDYWIRRRFMPENPLQQTTGAA